MRWILWPAALDRIGHDREDELKRACRVGDVKARRYNDGELLSSSFWTDARIDQEGRAAFLPRYTLLPLRDSGPLPPCEPIGIEIELGSLLETFPTKEPTQSGHQAATSRKGQPPGVEDWYVERTHCVDYSSRDEDLDAARAHFGRWTKDRDTIRALRKRHAPEHWKTAGPRSTT